jgi:hypothetical protein
MVWPVPPFGRDRALRGRLAASFPSRTSSERARLGHPVTVARAGGSEREGNRRKRKRGSRMPLEAHAPQGIGPGASRCARP